MVDDDQVLSDRDINFEVTNGVVTIKGEVRTAAEKTKATEIARAAPGVKDLANALEIRPK
jgi:osmotically-inducible protein OsmY